MLRKEYYKTHYDVSADRGHSQYKLKFIQKSGDPCKNTISGK